jgi:hypothetical protein
VAAEQISRYAAGAPLPNLVDTTTNLTHSPGQHRH